jgi:hypothetical protein
MRAPIFLVMIGDLNYPVFLYVIPNTNKSKYVRTVEGATRFKNQSVAAWWVKRLNDGSKVIARHE